MEQIISEEFKAPDFTTVDGKTMEYEKARYFYVYIANVHLSASFTMIRRMMPVYGYSKTVYQVFRRMYYRHKEDDNRFTIEYLKREYDNKVKDLKSKGIVMREDGKQMKIFA
jgi:hypothetical protein